MSTVLSVAGDVAPFGVPLVALVAFWRRIVCGPFRVRIKQADHRGHNCFEVRVGRPWRENPPLVKRIRGDAEDFETELYEATAEAKQRAYALNLARRGRA